MTLCSFKTSKTAFGLCLWLDERELIAPLLVGLSGAPVDAPPPPSDGLVYTPGLIHHRARARPARVSVSRNSIKMRNLIPGEQQQLFKYWNACCAAPAFINNIMYKAIHNINYESSMQVLFSAKLS